MKVPVRVQMTVEKRDPMWACMWAYVWDSEWVQMMAYMMEGEMEKLSEFR